MTNWKKVRTRTLQCRFHYLKLAGGYAGNLTNQHHHPTPHPIDHRGSKLKYCRMVSLCLKTRSTSFSIQYVSLSVTKKICEKLWNLVRQFSCYNLFLFGLGQLLSLLFLSCSSLETLPGKTFLDEYKWE